MFIQHPTGTRRLGDLLPDPFDADLSGERP
jgi:hypothetical protein